MAQPVAPKTIKHKRGDTFKKCFVLWADKAKTIPVDLGNYTIRSQVRKGPALIEELVPSIVAGSPGVFMVSAALPTVTWPVAELKWDVELSNNLTGQVISSETCIINCGEDITRP